MPAISVGLLALGVVLVGSCVFFAVMAFFPPPARASARIRPYVRGARARLGRPPDIAPEYRFGPFDILAPVILRLGRSVRNETLGRLIGYERDDVLEARFRQAGRAWRYRSAEDYRAKQLQNGLLGLLTGVLLVFVIPFRSPVLFVLLPVALCLVGLALQPSQIDRAIRVRRQRMRLELYPVVLRIAFQLRSVSGEADLYAALTSTLRRGQGELIDELDDILAEVHNRREMKDAFQDAAVTTPELSAARAYRHIRLALETGEGLTDGLLAIARDVRGELRREVQEQATWHRLKILAVMILIMLPVVFVLLGAPLRVMLFSSF